MGGAEYRAISRLRALSVADHHWTAVRSHAWLHASANEQSAALRKALQSGYQLHRDDNRFVISNDGATLQLVAIDPERTGSVFRTAPNARGYWRFQSLTVDGKAVAEPGRLDVTIPTELPVEGGYLSDGCNTFRGQYLRLDGQLFGAIQPLTELPPCSQGALFASTFQAW